jgi:hypothetical protein
MAEQPATRSRWPGVRSWCFMPARGLVPRGHAAGSEDRSGDDGAGGVASRIASRVLMRARFAPSPSSQVDANHVAWDRLFYPKGLLGPEHVDPWRIEIAWRFRPPTL